MLVKHTLLLLPLEPTGPECEDLWPVFLQCTLDGGSGLGQKAHLSLAISGLLSAVPGEMKASPWVT